jgi:hypothetical protein
VVNDFSVLEWAVGEDRRGMRLRGAALKVEQQSGQALVSNYDVLPWADEMIGRAASDPEYQKLLDEGDSMSVEEAISYALRRDDSP